MVDGTEDIAKIIEPYISKWIEDGDIPKIGGLFDPRMGVLEPGYVCPTDGLDYMKTPGYFGHIEFSRPVYWPHLLDHSTGLLKYICCNCSNLLIDL